MGDGDNRQRLAAILAADAVGYSRHMEQDEQATIAALQAARAVFQAEVVAHHGRVVDTAGDSVLAVFDSAAGAVRASLAVQASLENGTGSEAAAGRLRFRIGVHLGDVIETANQNVYGDGVNIAARLQALADPGGILVSDAVRGAIKNRVQGVFHDRGAQSVKNIGDQIHAFALSAGPASSEPRDVGTSSPTRAAGSRWPRLAIAGVASLCVVAALAVWWPRAPADKGAVSAGAHPRLAIPDKPSIAVLPFENIGGDPGQAYFADGMTEDLITDLSQVAGLFVIARNSTFAYKNRAHDVREIADALGVRYVLEGSVRKSGGDVRVNAQLIDATTGGHVWADRYDGDLKNIFALQDTVTRGVVKALAVKLTKGESDRVARRGTDSVDAYDAFLKGWNHYLNKTPQEFRAAIVDLKKAGEIDPNYGAAYAALAAIEWESFTRFWSEAVGLGPRNEDALYGAEQWLAKAMRSPTPLAHQVSSAMQLQARQHDDAIAEANRSIASDPNDANGYIALASALSFTGKPAEALAAIDTAMRLDPHYPSSYVYERGLAEFAADRVAEAALSLEKALAMNPDDYWSKRLLLASYGVLGRKENAAKLLSSMRSNDQRGPVAFIDPLTIKAITYWYPFRLPADARRFAQGLSNGGVPE